MNSRKPSMFSGPLTVSVGVILLLLGAGLWTTSRRMAVDASVLTVDPTQLSLGTLWEQDDYQWTFQIKNETSEAVHILRFQTSCNCVSTKPGSVTVPANGSADVTLAMNLARYSSDGQTEFSATVTPVIEEGLRPSPVVSWQFAAMVQRPFAVSPQVISLGGSRQLVKGAPVQPIRVSVVSLYPCRDVRAMCDQQWATARVEKSSDDASRFELSILPRDVLPVGRFEFPIHLSAVLMSGETVGRVPVEVKGEVVNDIGVFPETLQLGAVPLGTDLVQPFFLQSRLGEHFRVVDANVACEADVLPRLEVKSVPEASDGELGQSKYVVQGRLDRLGACSCTVTFTIEQEKGENITLSVPLKAYVIASEREED
ncbi:MAG: DUF1573 domain-containing protein [Planctomycetia bacterium]|nr:DUF1573 domain-containing protein [Planctomycetia bacterium]